MTLERAVSLSALSLVFASAASAQALAFLYGHIVDPSAAAVAGTSVTVVNEENGFRHFTTTESDGAYSVGPLTPGLYKLTVRKDGFRTMIRFHVAVDGARPARADFALSLGSVQETITVEDTSDPTGLGRRNDPAVTTQLYREDLDNLPLDGRGLLGLVEFAPGTNVVPATRGDPGQFVADGQRPNTNSFFVDGISANLGITAGGLPAQAAGGSLPILSAFGSLDSLIPVSAVQDFEIRTSSATSPFGRLPGAAVSITSRSGSNEFHGSAGYTFRNELLAANDWFANRAGAPRTELRENSVDTSLSGPIWRNQTFFFLGYEWMNLAQPFMWVEPVPSVTARAAAPSWAQPVLALYPLPNGPALGQGLAGWNGRDWRPSGLHAGSARLDHAFTPHLAAFAHYSDSPSYNEFGDMQVNRLDFRSWSATAGLNFQPTSSLGFSLRLNRSSTSVSSVWNGATGCDLQPFALALWPVATGCDALVRFDINGISPLASGHEGDRFERQWQAVDSVSWNRGTHTVQAGADWLRIEPERRSANATLSVIADSVAALDDSSGFWESRTPPKNQSTRVDELSLWAGDTWRLRPRLTVVAGVRWEYTPPPPIMAGADFVDPSGNVSQEPRPLWLMPYGHFAPRLGVTFSPGKSGKTVFRAGAGIYYDSSLSIATDLLNGGPLSLTFRSHDGLFPIYLNYGFVSNLYLPRVIQWNASVEHSLSGRDVVSVGYVGSMGNDLIRREVGGLGSSAVYWEALTTNNGSSRYDALVAQYRRRLAKGFDALASYSWSHSIDNASSDAFLLWAGSGLTPAGDRGSSDFDLRHSATASLHWALPGLAQGWSLEGIMRARSGFPVTVLDSQQYAGITLMNAFRPNVVPNVPLWIANAAVPGGGQLNPQAFTTAPNGQQGDLGRNALAGFGMWQLDLALNRQFRLTDRRSLELRIQAFNALNHANFADPVRFLNSAYFGQSTSMLNLMLGTGSSASGLAPLLQNGGPRSLAVMLRFRF